MICSLPVNLAKKESYMSNKEDGEQRVQHLVQVYREAQGTPVHVGSMTSNAWSDARACVGLSRLNEAEDGVVGAEAMENRPRAGSSLIRRRGTNILGRSRSPKPEGT